MSFCIISLLRPGGKKQRCQRGHPPGPTEGMTEGLHIQIILLTSVFFLSSEASEIAVPHGSGITVLIKPGTPTLPAKACYIVVFKKHVTTLSIKSGERTVFSFSCQDPENHFVVEIQKNIGKCALGDRWAPVPVPASL